MLPIQLVKASGEPQMVKTFPKRAPYSEWSVEQRKEYNDGIINLKKQLKRCPYVIVAYGSSLIDRPFEELVHRMDEIEQVKQLWTEYCLLENMIAEEYEYRYKTDGSRQRIKIEYNGWPQFRMRPVTSWEPKPRYPKLRKLSLNQTFKGKLPSKYLPVIPGQSWMDCKRENWIIMDIINRGYLRPRFM